MKRRNILVAITSLVVLAISSPSQSSGPLVTVFKTPTCGCCGKWVEHLKANGFTVKVQEVNVGGAERRGHYGSARRGQGASGGRHRVCPRRPD